MRAASEVEQVLVTRRQRRWGNRWLPRERGVMSVQFDPSRNRWVVRSSEAGRQRTRRFAHRKCVPGLLGLCRCGAL